MLKKQLKLVSIATLVGLLAACGDDDDNNNDDMMTTEPPAPVVFKYQVSVTNLTHAQPFSPVAIVSHDEGQLWEIGQPASVALEKIAESGDSADLFQLDLVTSSAGGADIVMPGANEAIELEVQDNAPMYLSVVTMLVNTNDAYTGKTAINVSELAVGDSMSMNLPTYDAGTEANSEMEGTIPGPADSGEGYNATRDDVDRVSKHPGVVTMNDGLDTSVLSFSHRFDNPTMKVVITRTE